MDKIHANKLKIMEREVAEILDFLNEQAPESPTQLTERLSTISAYNARTGEMLADAEYILTIQRGEELDKLIAFDPKMPASQQKTMVDARCADAIRICRLIERANRSCVHAMEACITLVSFSKEEMSLSRKGY